MLLKEIKKNALKEFDEIKDLESLEKFRIKYLGREGSLTKILRSLKDFSLAKRKKIGPQANQLKEELLNLIKEKKGLLLKQQIHPPLDISLPGRKKELGHLHILSQLEEQCEKIFISLGFSVVEGPEIETEFHNFDALNLPPEHPAREMWDTFWLKNYCQSKNSRENFLLRTHTSPVQIRFMETHQPPFRIIAPGRVFRYERSDASHDIQFYQIEGLMVDKNVSLANFKYIMSHFFQKLFSKKIKVRFRPSYFPFVEPGLEIDLSCPHCQGKGCSICSQNGWLEIAGAGMVHPNVFKAVGYLPQEWQGFAFGMGLDRLAMIKYKIPDIRLFYSGDLRFIKQF